ncbi:acyl-CoA thioesterase [Blastococcus sp. Marseille-P5729]|uniref:acyl-CoA thioesterase n=1 Tax=Blastococcus sp. Marseille-P5729 TaxID=2086582 RepID=UPI00351A0A46
MTGRVDDEEIITAVGSFGARDSAEGFQWSHPTRMPPPRECEVVEMWPAQGPDALVIQHMEARMRPGEYAARSNGQVSDSGRISLWLRTKNDLPVDAGVLALFADFVPSVIALSMGRRGGGSSLDNTLRVVRLVPTRWVLCVIDAHGVDHGMGHGDIHLYAETGELLGVGSQSCLMRFFTPQ